MKQTMYYLLLLLAELLEEDYVFLAIQLIRRKICKTLTIRKDKRSHRINWRRPKLGWTLDRHWKIVIFSDETQVAVDQNKREYVWRIANEVW